MATKNARQYWLATMLGWAQVRLSPPQFDEALEVIIELLEQVDDSDTLEYLARDEDYGLDVMMIRQR